MPILLTIAGSDSGGGAGIQADLKTFEAHGCFGTSALVALTAQNTQGVRRVEAVSPETIEAQLEALFDDLVPQAIKVGMLGSARVVHQVAQLLRRLAAPLGIPIVVDPVMVATSGDVLLEPDAISALLAELFPLALIVTPNRHEAARLADRAVDTVAEAVAAAERIHRHAPQAQVLIKGLHTTELSVGGSTDVLWSAGGEVREFTLPWLEVPSTHGTGCTLSSAIAARLALGHSLAESVRLAKAYVHAAIAAAPPNVGQGHTPLRHRIVLPE